jgi:cytochrome c peroxidase
MVPCSGFTRPRYEQSGEERRRRHSLESPTVEPFFAYSANGYRTTLRLGRANDTKIQAAILNNLRA